MQLFATWATVCIDACTAPSCLSTQVGNRLVDCVLPLLRVCCNRLLATGGNDTLICIWDLQQAVPQTVIYRPDEAVRALSFSADHALLAYCQEHVQGQPSSVEVMDAKTGAGWYHRYNGSVQLHHSINFEARNHVFYCDRINY